MAHKPRKDDQHDRWIRVSDLSVLWAEAQRGLSDRKVERIMDGFDPDAFGSVICTKPNGRGVYHIVDGQHRVEAVRRMWGDGQMVPCIVVNATDPAEAADIWLKINGERTRPSAIDRFKRAVTAGRKDEVAVNDLITGLGYSVQAATADGSLRAVTSCMKVYEKYGLEALRQTFLVIQGMYGMDAQSVVGFVIEGVAEALCEADGIDPKRVVDRVSKKYTPARLIGAARSSREMWQGTVAHNVALVIVNTYNHGLGGDSRVELAA